MGLFDFFKKKDNKTQVNQNVRNIETTQQKSQNIKVNNIRVQDQKPEFYQNISYSRTEDGRLQIEFFNPNAQYRDFYDTTRLRINGRTDIGLEVPVYSCDVSYYSVEDAMAIAPNGKDISRKERYSKILAQFDYNQLRDPSYAEFLLKNLLNEKRVKQYLNRGMQDNPDIKCGNYVGGIGSTENGLRKIFNHYIGNMVHNLPYMANARKARNERIDAEREAKRKRLEEQLSALNK